MEHLAETGQHAEGKAYADNAMDEKEIIPQISCVAGEDRPANKGTYAAINGVHRGLGAHHVALIAIGGAIGASIFISVGDPLTQAGPLCLILGMAIWAMAIWGFAMCLTEMVTTFPFSGGFVYLAGRFLDPAAQFALGYNYVVGCIALVCFEVTALNVLVEYWDPNINPAIVITAGLAGLLVCNMMPVRIYGEIEFYIAITKVLLMVGLMLFTFITMLGGNPLHDRYGFRFWRDPGVFTHSTAWLRLQDLWNVMCWATFAIGGPEYVSMSAGEVSNPRRILPKAYKSTIYRIIGLYLGCSLAVSVNAPYNDPSLLGAIANGAPGAAKSPFIINMNRLKIKYLPSIVNATVMMSVFSAGSSYLFIGSRTLHGLALQRHAPRIFTRTTSWGVPYMSIAFILIMSCLSYLAVNSGTVKVLNWFINLTSATQLIIWINIGSTYFRFRAGMKSQNIPRSWLPSRGTFQPYLGIYGLSLACVLLLFSGYYMMAPGGFSAANFVFTYGAVFLYIALFIFWKAKGLINGSQKGFGYSPASMDFSTGLEEIEALTIVMEERRVAAGGSIRERLVTRAKEMASRH